MRPLFPSSRSARPGAGLALVLALALAVPARAGADEPAAPAHDVARALPDPGDAPGAVSFAPTRRTGAAAFSERLREVRAAHALALAALRDRLVAAGRAERQRLQREIETLKRAQQAELVAEQVARARAFGHESVALQLERRLAALRAPAPTAPRGGR